MNTSKMRTSKTSETVTQTETTTAAEAAVARLYSRSFATRTDGGTARRRRYGDPDDDKPTCRSHADPRFPADRRRTRWRRRFLPSSRTYVLSPCRSLYTDRRPSNTLAQPIKFRYVSLLLYLPTTAAVTYPGFHFLC